MSRKKRGTCSAPHCNNLEFNATEQWKKPLCYIHFARIQTGQTGLNHSRRPWQYHRKDGCIDCGITAFQLGRLENKSRKREGMKPLKGLEIAKVGFGCLDVDHIDGNKKNNDPSNLQTLCATCHRRKSNRHKDCRPGRNKGKRSDKTARPR